MTSLYSFVFIIYIIVENCHGFLCHNGSRSNLFYTVEPPDVWSPTCQGGFVPLAITTTDIQDDISELFNLTEPHWVAGTNMRWVWITGLNNYFLKYMCYNM